MMTKSSRYWSITLMKEENNILKKLLSYSTCSRIIERLVTQSSEGMNSRPLFSCSNSYLTTRWLSISSLRLLRLTKVANSSVSTRNWQILASVEPNASKTQNELSVKQNELSFCTVWSMLSAKTCTQMSVSIYGCELLAQLSCKRAMKATWQAQALLEITTLLLFKAPVHPIHQLAPSKLINIKFVLT